MAEAPLDAVKKPINKVIKKENDKPFTETIGIIIWLIVLPKALVINSSIKSTDCKCTVKATDIEYEIKNNSDYIEYKGEKYIIVENTQVTTGNKIAIFILQLRKIV